MMKDASKEKLSVKSESESVEIPKENIDFLLNSSFDNLAVNEDFSAFDYKSFNLLCDGKAGKQPKKNKGKRKNKDDRPKEKSKESSKNVKAATQQTLKSIFNDIDIDISVGLSDDDSLGESDSNAHYGSDMRIISEVTNKFKGRNLLASDDEQRSISTERQGSQPFSRLEVGKLGENKRKTQKKRNARSKSKEKEKSKGLKFQNHGFGSQSLSDNGTRNSKPKYKPKIDVAKLIDDKLNESDTSENISRGTMQKRITITTDDFNSEENRYYPVKDTVYTKLKEKYLKKKPNKKDSKKTQTNKAPIELSFTKETQEDEKDDLAQATAEMKDQGQNCPSNKVLQFIETIDPRLYNEPLSSDFNQGVALKANPELQAVLRLVLSTGKRLLKKSIRMPFFKFIIRLTQDSVDPLTVFREPKFSKLNFLSELDDIVDTKKVTEGQPRNELIDFDALRYFGFITFWIIDIVRQSNSLHVGELTSTRSFFACSELSHHIDKSKGMKPHIWTDKARSKRQTERLKHLRKTYKFDKDVFVLILRCLDIKLVGVE